MTIYDALERCDSSLWIPTSILETILNESLDGYSLSGLAIRTRSKVVKVEICKALGYPVPKSFRKTQPRFQGQDFDVYIQKSNNLQIWNEEVLSSRRYVLIKVDENDSIARVKVVSGDTLAALDKTGTLTQKFQARCDPPEADSELIDCEDTPNLIPFIATDRFSLPAQPNCNPIRYQVFSIQELYKRLEQLVGQSFEDAGVDQERNRGAGLHSLVCESIGYGNYHDDGQFPDIRNQLLEIKLQTSPTIDLGRFLPESQELLTFPGDSTIKIRHCDVRYAIFCADTDGSTVSITNLILTTGASFFSRFPQFQGKVKNSKLQIPLPMGFFDS